MIVSPFNPQRTARPRPATTIPPMTTNSFANLPVNTPQHPAIPTRPPRFPADRSRAGRRARANSPGAAHIRSFVHRRGHITQGQLAALEQLLGKWSLPYAARRLDPAAAFGREAPTVLEIGFGMGETTEKIALARPGDNFLGVEVFNAGVGSLLRRIEDSSIQNLRIIQHDAVEVVRDMIAPDSLAGVHIYFPTRGPRSAITSAA